MVLSLLIASALLLAGIAATKVASRFGVPALVMFILVGILLGSDVTGWIYFDDAWTAQLVGSAALAVILFEGGLQTKWQQLRKVALPGLSLATVGVLVTMTLTGLLAWRVLGLELPFAMLLGAIVGSTDAAAVFAVIGGLKIRQRLKATLEAESGLNDPMAVFLTLLLLDWVRVGQPHALSALLLFVKQMAIGLLFGLALGWITTRIVVRIRLGASGLYPILLFSGAIFTFAFTSWLQGSGFVAVYVLAVYLGSRELPHRHSILRFHEGMAWLAQMVMFILLGLLVFPKQLMPVVVPGLLIAAGLMFVARPVAVWLSTMRMGFTGNERLFLSWAGLRGAVPIVLATFPMLAGIPHSNTIFNVVFFVVLTSTLIQGATISPLASALGLADGLSPVNPVKLELITMEEVDMDFVEVQLPPGSPFHGKRLAEINLPDLVTVSAILRSGLVLSPRGSTRLHAGDVLFILTNKTQIQKIRSTFEQHDSDGSDEA